MIRFGSTGQKRFKGLHLIAVICWIGGAVPLVLLNFLKPGVQDGGVLYGSNHAVHVWSWCRGRSVVCSPCGVSLSMDR